MLTLALNATSEIVINPAIRSYIETIKTVETEECIEISQDQARIMMINAVYPSPSENDQPNIDKMVALFDEEYKKQN